MGLAPELASRFPHELSGGQRQRVNIARALAVRPGFVVCDEPVSALDATSQIEIMDLLVDLKTRLNLSYLFITHNIGLAQTYCDRIAVMYLGKIVEVASLVRGSFKPSHPYTIALCDSIPHPDPSRRDQGPAIAGDIPVSSVKPSGCVFHPRCPMASDLCRLEVPRFRGQKRAFQGPLGGLPQSQTRLKFLRLMLRSFRNLHPNFVMDRVTCRRHTWEV